MSTTTTAASERLADQIVLDIKSLMLLNSSEEAMKKLIEDRLTFSKDEQILRFVSMLHPKKTQSTKGAILAAMGEMVLASFFVVVGLAILAPSIAGFNTPDQLLAYFAQIITSSSAQSFASNPVVPIIEFVLSLVLILGGFYNLRMAASSLDGVKSISSPRK